MIRKISHDAAGAGEMTLFLGGDTMLGRGVDQILPHPGDPELHESWVKSATGYLELAESVNGPIRRPVSFAYPWGDALAEDEIRHPDARIINLETAVTRSGDWWRGKGIHYRMSPANIPCLAAGQIDCCLLANNHVMDWGRAGLEETLATLREAGIAVAGAGRNAEEARAPAILPLPGRKGRLLVFAWGAANSGVPREWEALADRPGVARLEDFSTEAFQSVASAVTAWRRETDLTVVSIHWGANWDYAIPDDHTRFAHRLIDEAGVDVVHGHSSHHPLAVEVHRSKPILYGCGDLVNDYEGIRGYGEFRPDLGFLHYLTLAIPSRRLLSLEFVPKRVDRFRIERATEAEAAWLRRRLNEGCAAFGGRVDDIGNGRLFWAGARTSA